MWHIPALGHSQSLNHNDCLCLLISADLMCFHQCSLVRLLLAFIVLVHEREGLFFLQVAILTGLSFLRTGEVAEKRDDIVCGRLHIVALWDVINRRWQHLTRLMSANLNLSDCNIKVLWIIILKTTPASDRPVLIINWIVLFYANSLVSA